MQNQSLRSKNIRANDKNVMENGQCVSLWNQEKWGSSNFIVLFGGRWSIEELTVTRVSERLAGTENSEQSMNLRRVCGAKTSLYKTGEV